MGASDPGQSAGYAVGQWPGEIAGNDRRHDAKESINGESCSGDHGRPDSGHIEARRTLPSVDATVIVALREIAAHHYCGGKIRR